MATIQVNWRYITWEAGHTWAKNMLPQLEAFGITEEHLNRAVYIIRTCGKFAIDYPNKPSPTLYIGEGCFKNRIEQHKKWLTTLIDLIGEFPIEIAIDIPRAKNNVHVYREMEADLLHEFKSIYGMAPFLNKQMENHFKKHIYEPYNEFIKPLQIG